MEDINEKIFSHVDENITQNYGLFSTMKILLLYQLARETGKATNYFTANTVMVFSIQNDFLNVCQGATT